MPKNFKRIVAALLLTVVFLSSGGVYAFGYTVPMDVQMCVNIAISKDKDLRSLRMEIVDTQNNLGAVMKSMRQDSLWAKIKLAWNTAYSNYETTINRYNSLVDLQQKLKDLLYSQSEIRFRIKNEVQQAYYEVVEQMFLLEMQQNETKTCQNSVSKLTLQKIQGVLINDGDITLAKDKLADSKTQEKNIEDNLTDAKKRLGDLFDVDLRTGYTFSARFYTDEVDDGVITINVEDAIQYGLMADKDSAMAYYEYMAAKTVVAYVTQLYWMKFGYVMGYIRSYLWQNVDTMDFNDFKSAYNRFYSHIDDPWDWWFFIWIPLFWVIPIYVMWFRPSYLSTRYLGDEKYALYNLLKEEYKAQIAYEKAYKQKKREIENGYTTLRNMRNAYNASLTELERVKREYSIAYSKNMAGTLSYEQLEDVRERVVTTQNDTFEALLDYNSELSNFDYTTRGYVWYLLTGTTFKVALTDAGRSWGTEDERPVYTINANVEDLTVEFAVHMNNSPLEATHYEVWTKEGKQVGVRTAINSPLMHLSLVFAIEDTMYVKLYDGDKYIAKSMFDGTVPQGYLDFEEGEEAAPVVTDDTAGTFALENGPLTSTLTLTFNEKLPASAVFYSLKDNETGATLGGEDSRTNIKAGFVHLTSALNDFENLTVIVYTESGAELSNKYALSEKNGANIIIEK